MDGLGRACRRVQSAAGGLLLLAAALAGCRKDEAQARARSEAAAVSRAVDALRAADNDKKPVFLQALRDVPCTEPDVCAVRSACLAAYELHVRALARLGDARRLVDAGALAGVAAELDAAQDELARAKTLTDDCTTQQGELVRRHRVGR